MIDPTSGAPQAFATQDLAQVQTSLDAISLSADKVSKSLVGAFTTGITSGKSFDQTLQGIALSMGKMVLQASMQPLTQGLSGLLTGVFSGIGGGASAGASSITPFADGGIVSQPTWFGAGGSAGLMGERGAEAILPLARGPDGRLGLATDPSPSAGPVNITITTPDPQAFSRSQVQVSSALARAVSFGQRGL